MKCWAFGEVKKIHGPVSVPDSGKNIPKKPKEPKMKQSVIPSNVTAENVIPHNVPVKSDCTLRKRAIAIPKKMTEHKSNRKHQIVDYSKFNAGADESSNLMHKPSKTVLAAHKKHKMMSPLSAGKTATMTKEQSVHIPCTEAKASTSTSTTAKAEPLPISTLTVDASKEETETAIAALLSLGSDMPPPEEDLTTENAALVPINPNIMVPIQEILHTKLLPSLIHQLLKRLQYLYTRGLLLWSTSSNENIANPENSPVPNVEKATVHRRRSTAI